MNFNTVRKNITSGLELTRFSCFDEIKTIFSDKGAMLILLAVIIYPVIYSVAYMNNVVRDIPVEIVDLDHTSSSRQVIRMIDATKEVMNAGETGSLDEAKQMFWDGDSKGVILIPEGFEKNLLKGVTSTISVYSDASNFLIYKETLNGIISATGTLSAGVEIKRLLMAGNGGEQAMLQRDPVPAKFYNLYNPSGAYGSYLMPGLILIVIQQTLLIAIGIIGGAGKEKRNNQEIKPGLRVRDGLFSVVFGKGLAYFIIYLMLILFSLVCLPHWFGLPEKGSFGDVLILLVPYLFSVIFLGFTISMLFRRREHAIMSLVFISPVVLFLSGVPWPETSIPPILYQAAHIFPSTTMIPSYLRIRTMGVSIADVSSELLFMLVQMIIYFVLAVLSFKFSVIRQEKKIKISDKQATAL
jgi:ABC-2 type transport system permease protein